MEKKNDSSFYDTFGSRKIPLVLTLDEIVKEARMQLKPEYELESSKIAGLTKILEEDNMCWVGVKWQSGHWTKLPNNRTLNDHWKDQQELDDLNKDNWKSRLDFQTPFGQLSQEQYDLFLIYSEYHLERFCRTCRNELQETEKFLWLSGMFECFGHEEGIQLCHRCLHSFLELL